MTPRAPRDPRHLPLAQLEAGLEAVRLAPADHGRVELIVRRPRVEEREVVAQGVVDEDVGLVGDCWLTRGSSSTADGLANPDAQLTLMSSRAIDLIAGDRARWALAGDQFFVDLDLSAANLAPGVRLALGGAVVEVTAQPHLGCGKFLRRFGVDAVKFVNSQVGRELKLRGINARVIAGGTVRTGDDVCKVG